MAAIDDYVVTPGGGVDVGGNPVTYDASGNINPTYTTDLSSNLSGLTSILGQFKGVFDRLKSGNTTTADVNAALGVLGLIMPSLTAPKTAGWKGSIDLNRQFTRTPTAPIAYTPYSGQPVMGRQYFTSAYGAPGAPAPAPADSVPAPAPAPQQQPNYTESSGMAQGGIAMLAGGGEVNLRSGDFVFPADVTAFAGSGSNAAGKENLADAIGAIPIEITKGDGMSDDIPANIDGVRPAAVARDEMIVPRERVAEIGNGSLDRGAEKLYAMMDRIRQHATGSKDQIKPMEDIRQFTPGGIAGYAGGGAVAFNAGGAAPPTPTAPLGTSTETNISSWAGPYVGDMLSKTSALTNAPYQAWTGPLSAGYSPLQQKTFTGLESLSFPGQLGQSFTGTGAPTLPTASTTGPTQTVGGPTGIAANYMNPYLNAVLQPQLEELRRQSQISEMGSAAKFAQAGGYGGGREAIMRAEGQRNLLGEMNKAIGTGYASAYDKALQQFNTEQGQARTLAEMMAGAGATQRGIEQEGITEARKQFETEQLKPYTDLRFQKEMLSGLPVATTATTANTSTMGDIRGGLADLQKALAALGVG